MAKQRSKPEITITPSGHEVDKELARVPIKVSPPLQALLANQMELIEMAEGKASRNLVFIEQHKLEMLQLEEEIAGAFSNYTGKKEKARAKRMEKQSAAEGVFEQMQVPVEPETGPAASWPAENDDYDEPPFDIISTDNDYFAVQPAGLPSSKYEPRRDSVEAPKEETDVRRVALGAAIKALQAFLDRELTEEEMQSLEAQVDSYLG